MWIPEITRKCPHTPVVLVGLKADLRDDLENDVDSKKRSWTPIHSKQGFAMAKEIGAVTYLECSAKNETGIKKVFEEAARAAALHPPRKQKKKKCARI